VIAGLSVLALIPARGGSKGIPRKNVRPFLGRPLVAWAVAAGLASERVDRVVVSTDDEEVAAAARAAGAEAPFLRPADLATDLSPTAPAVAHALAWLDEVEGWSCDLVVILEPTSPGRRPAHVDRSLELLVEREADSVASVTEVPHHYVACKQLELHDDGTLAGPSGAHVRDLVHRRQDLPRRYAFDGIVYGCRAPLLRADPPTIWGERVVGLSVDHAYAVDLDRPEDWLPAEARLREVLL